MTDLEKVDSLKIKRYILKDVPLDRHDVNRKGNHELVIFTDASKDAYASICSIFSTTVYLKSGHAEQ